MVSSSSPSAAGLDELVARGLGFVGHARGNLFQRDLLAVHANEFHLEQVDDGLEAEPFADRQDDRARRMPSAFWAESTAFWNEACSLSSLLMKMTRARLNSSEYCQANSAPVSKPKKRRAGAAWFRPAHAALDFTDEIAVAGQVQTLSLQSSYSSGMTLA